MVVLLCKVCVVMVFSVCFIDVIVDLVLIVWRIRLNFDLGRLGWIVIFVLVFFDNLYVLCFFEFVMVYDSFFDKKIIWLIFDVLIVRSILMLL